MWLKEERHACEKNAHAHGSISQLPNNNLNKQARNSTYLNYIGHSLLPNLHKMYQGTGSC